METEIKTKSREPVVIKWISSVSVLTTKMGENVVDYEYQEAIQLRNFLNQLELGE